MDKIINKLFEVRQQQTDLLKVIEGLEIIDPKSKEDILKLYQQSVDIINDELNNRTFEADIEAQSRKEYERTHSDDAMESLVAAMADYTGDV